MKDIHCIAQNATLQLLIYYKISFLDTFVYILFKVIKIVILYRVILFIRTWYIEAFNKVSFIKVASNKVVITK